MNLAELSITEDKLKQFNKAGINTVEDLLSFYPTKYYDFSAPVTSRNLPSGTMCSMIVYVTDIKKHPSYVLVTAREYESRDLIYIKWFSQPYKIKEVLPFFRKNCIVCGKFDRSEYGCQFVNPLVFSDDIDSNKSIYSVYSNIPKMSSDYLKKTLSFVINNYLDGIIEERFDDNIRKKFNIVTKKEMYKLLHFPSDSKDIVKARMRIVFEDLYDLAYKMAKDSSEIQKLSPYRPVYLNKCNSLIRNLPYDLTDDQKNIISQIIDKGKKGERINALIQGDVGSGKTICAFLLMVCMVDNGFQAALMAPTGVLARQHYNDLCKMVNGMGINVVFLSGEQKASEKKDVLKKIKSKEADIVVGTHAVLSDDVEFANLGLYVIDEEHKFGVIQRDNLRKKANDGVHSITMSATPIPRTLAMSLYGDALDIYTINSMPIGRKSVKTCVSNSDSSIFDFMLEQIKEGHQCYVVCPLIDGEQDDDKAKPVSVAEIFEKLSDYYRNNDVKIEVINGKMTDAEKSEIIERFKNNETQILVSTTIIEVGVNVPNATVITVMNAERFGLAGLHQLRGRVGRSSLQSYCILKSVEKDNPRLQAMCDTTNGFEIANKDLAMRGTGDFVGVKQSGYNRLIMLMLRYPETYQSIKSIISIGDKLEFTKGEN